MARVTVEDCILKVDNRFDLIVLAAHRGREITAGSELTVSRDNDKNPVVSLREIADETIKIDDLKDSMVASLQTLHPQVQSALHMQAPCISQSHL